MLQTIAEIKFFWEKTFIYSSSQTEFLAFSSFSDAPLGFSFFFEIGKSQTEPYLANIEAGMSLHHCLWLKIHEEAMKCVWVCFFYTNAGVFLGLLDVNVVELADTTPYRPFDLVAKTHDALGIPLISKSTVTITFTFDRSCQAFFDLVDLRCLHWNH